MKIVIIATHYLPHVGGLELATYHLAKELEKQNNEIHIITPYPDPNKNTTSIHIHRHPIHTYPDEHPIRAFIDGLIFFRKTMKTIKEIRPDIIHAQNITNSIPAYLAWKIYHIPYVICIHGNLELMGPFLPDFLKRFWPKFPHIKAAAEIIALTNEMATRFGKELGKIPAVIPNGVDLERFYPAQIDEKKISISPVILTLSRIDNKKGLEYAIESMTKIHAKFPTAKLQIVGEGEYRKELENLAEKNTLSATVEFTGLVPNSEVPNYLRNADLFLLPSLYEGLPLTLLEAMACGLPIISTPVSIAPEIIATWKNGYIIPFKSPDAISKSVIDLLSNPDKRRQCAENSNRAAKETLSWEKVAKKYTELYQLILESN
ncbi:MAG: glycosyltransferase family 4 protein [Paludibacter sp.]|nr:glycosyltransferase family 4 protein [Paludibacter sp.]